MAQVVLKQLTKRFDEVVAVDGIDLHINDKELVVLVGPSGCGKTTTLRMVAGLESITAGDISIGERVVNQVAPKDRNVAMVFQNYALYPHMTVYKNMEFGLKMRRMPKPERMERIKKAAGILGIEELMHRKPAQLSGGQRQRVAVGRAIVRDPQVFLFDEPLSNLDAKLRVTMRTELVKLHQRLEATMIYVTHDQVEAMMMGDRIVVMNDGRIQQVGPPLEVYNSPANQFVAAFIGSPPMNFLKAQLAEREGRLAIQVGTEQLTLSPEQHSRYSEMGEISTTLGIRPEHVVVNNSQSSTDLSGTVIVAQPLGAETLVELECHGQELIAKVSSEHHFSRQQQVGIGIDLNHIQLFDSDSGEVLG
jgi:multiple sugar transport system ATP-binding protein